jgi:hypothetical protein
VRKMGERLFKTDEVYDKKYMYYVKPEEGKISVFRTLLGRKLKPKKEVR